MKIWKWDEVPFKGTLETVVHLNMARRDHPRSKVTANTFVPLSIMWYPTLTEFMSMVIDD